MAGSSPDPWSDDEAAYRLLEQCRWGGDAVPCPHCGSVGRCVVLTPSGGRPRRTRTGAPTARRVWKCGTCRRQFSVLTGTVLEGTKVPVSSWIRAVGELVDRADGRADEPARIRAVTGLRAEGARHLLARWTEAADCEPLRSELRRPRQ